MCAAIHSILHVRNSIEPLAEEMGLSSLCRTLQQSHNEAGQVSQQTSRALTRNAAENMDAKLDEIFYTIARRVNTQIIILILIETSASVSSLLIDNDALLLLLFPSTSCRYYASVG